MQMCLFSRFLNWIVTLLLLLLAHGKPSAKSKIAFGAVSDSPDGKPVTTYSGHFHTVKLREELAAVVDDFLPPRLLDRMRAEAKLFERELDGMEKISAFWAPMNRKKRTARCALEHAIERMLSIDFPDQLERRAVDGAEWWFQLIKNDGDINFHFDKDEALNSLEGVVRNPSEGTITYLTSGASPTMILNRTSPDGFANDPLLPRNAAIVYPRDGRHVMFRGNLNHGVLGPLSVAKGESDRITFLVNWWLKKPPCKACFTLDDATVDRVLARGNLARWSPTVANDLGEASEGVLHPLQAVEFNQNEAVTHYEVELRFMDRMLFALPLNFDRSAMEAWSVKWREGGIFTQYMHIDLKNEQLIGWYRNSEEPKLLVFLPWTPVEKFMESKRVVLFAARAFVGVGKVMFADAYKHTMILNDFGMVTSKQKSALFEKGVPVVVMSEARKRRHVAMTATYSAGNIEKFVNKYIRGRSKLIPDGARREVDDDDDL